MKEQIICPCCSGKSYEQCCQRFHQGLMAQTSVELMRSRYSAYAMNLPHYIIRTTHPASPQFLIDKTVWKRKITNFSRANRFEKLEILDSKEHDSLATVTFIAHMHNREGEETTFTEKSYFEKIGKEWLYRSGQLTEGHAPNLITTDQLRLLPLAYYGDPVLQKEAQPINEITDDVQKLVADMIETMDACCGIGLAAPQVHHSIQLFIIRAPIETETGELETGEVEVFINPILSEPSDDTWTISEGCLSVPTIYGDVARPKEITVEYTTLDGKRIKSRFSGWKARVIMHENDHIHGHFFTEKVISEKKKALDPLLNNLKKRIHDRTAL